MCSANKRHHSFLTLTQTPRTPQLGFGMHLPVSVLTLSPSPIPFRVSMRASSSSSISVTAFSMHCQCLYNELCGVPKASTTVGSTSPNASIFVRCRLCVLAARWSTSFQAVSSRYQTTTIMNGSVVVYLCTAILLVTAQTHHQVGVHLSIYTRYICSTSGYFNSFQWRYLASQFYNQLQLYTSSLEQSIKSALLVCCPSGV